LQEEKRSSERGSAKSYEILQAFLVDRGTFPLYCVNKSTCTARFLFYVYLKADGQSVRPDFRITLMRTPHLAPKYASFWVPLSFNKLDFKSYLKNVYNVDVLHIRSYVQQQQVRREERQIGKFTRQGQGRLYRPPARKKMTVELVDPFVYPEEETDLAPYVIIRLFPAHVFIVADTISADGKRRPIKGS
jgi:ribosomal protein L23